MSKKECFGFLSFRLKLYLYLLKKKNLVSITKIILLLTQDLKKIKNRKNPFADIVK